MRNSSAVALLAGPLASLLSFAGCSKEQEPVPPSARPETRLVENGPPVAHSAEDTGAFVDVTERSGIAFRHVSGTAGKYYLIETFGGGAAWFDYDSDGFLDLYIVNGHEDPANAMGPGKARDVL